MKLQLHQRGSLHIATFNMMNAVDVQEVVLVVVRQQAFHLRRIHAAVGLTYVDHGQIQSAIDATRSRLKERADLVRWIVADITQVEHIDPVDVWHDRAVFHFLTEETDRRHYVNLLQRSLVPGGHAIIGTFGTGGPLRCSGLEIRQYDAATLSADLGENFLLIRSFEEDHLTPAGKIHRFFFAAFKRRTGDRCRAIQIDLHLIRSNLPWQHSGLGGFRKSGDTHEATIRNRGLRPFPNDMRVRVTDSQPNDVSFRQLELP